MSRVFTAKFGGRCGACDEAIRAGDQIRYDGDSDELVHDDCENTVPAPRPHLAVVCDQCHLTKPCDCGEF